MSSGKKKIKKVIYWLPRLLAVAFVIFISLFAFDVSGQSRWFLALLIHLIPSYLLTVITFVAWRNETIGGILFLIAGIGLLLFTHFEALILALPTLVIGLLFLINGQFFKKRSH